MPDHPVPKGLVFFTPETPPDRRRRRLVFAVIVGITALALIWPIYPLASATFPLVLGLPLSLAWPILWLTVIFVSLIWLYLREE
ncbi:MAG: hypothetical protein ACE5G0_10960 [Rhodothermales bacterium]